MWIFKFDNGESSRSGIDSKFKQILITRFCFSTFADRFVFHFDKQIDLRVYSFEFSMSLKPPISSFIKDVLWRTKKLPNASLNLNVLGVSVSFDITSVISPSFQRSLGVMGSETSTTSPTRSGVEDFFHFCCWANRQRYDFWNVSQKSLRVDLRIFQVDRRKSPLSGMGGRKVVEDEI